MNGGLTGVVLGGNSFPPPAHAHNPHLTPQWAAVTTQFSLMREPPQKWKPVLSWEERGG